MIRKTVDYARLGVEACEAFMEGPEAYEDFVRTILAVAAPLHAAQTLRRDEQPELLGSFTHLVHPLSETRH
jgi:hypothetical protein